MSIEIFCCYARKDRSLLQKLLSHLAPLQRQELITIWADTNIGAGVEWERELEKHLNTSQIILLLISSDFMASEYCYSREMKRAMERHNQGDAQVIPIILRSVDWKDTPFGILQALPTDGKPVRSWRDQDKAFVSVVAGIRSAIKKLTSVVLMPNPLSSLVSKSIEILPASGLSEWNDLPAPLQPDKNNLHPLTVQQIRSAWERVVKRVKQKSPTTAAMLRYYDIVSVEEMIGQPLLVIQAQKQGLYTYVYENERWKDIEWALTIEFSRQCKVRLLPPLTVQQIRSVWERVTKRVKQKSPTTAAMLKYYDIVTIEAMDDQPAIVIQAQKQGHYTYVHENERWKDIEWALTTELGQSCRVRLLPPLTVEQVKSVWESVMKRVKERNPLTAAMLNYYDINDVESTAGQFIIILQAQKQGHYAFVSENDHSKDVEWALTTELGQSCRVRLLPPERYLGHSVGFSI